MQRRVDVWRQHLMGDSIDLKRHLYKRFIEGRRDIDKSTQITIRSDMPRTFPKIQWVQDNIQDIQTILTEYAAVHKADGYLQGFNYIASIIFYVMKDQSEWKIADTWWCLAAVVGRVRPFIPDFNIAWFGWCERHWMGEFYSKIAKKRPTLSHILSKQKEAVAKLIPCKWFMIWFSQTVAFEEIFLLWDFLIQLPPDQLMKAYILITYEIFNEQATSVSYKWAHADAAEVLMQILQLEITGIANIINKVTKQF